MIETNSRIEPSFKSSAEENILYRRRTPSKNSEEMSIAVPYTGAERLGMRINSC